MDDRQPRLAPGGIRTAIHRHRRAFRKWWQDLQAVPRTADAADLRSMVLAQHPPFVAAVMADAKVAAKRRGDRHQFRSRTDAGLQVLRLAIVTDAFFAQMCYRAKAHCQVRRIPLIPRALHRLAMMSGQICIGDPAVLQPGVYIPHGQVVVDALTVVHRGATLSPFTTLGRVAGVMGGPTIGPFATIGTGAKVLGPVQVGAQARVGANAVVLCDVPRGATAVGVPARVISGRPSSGGS